jgi:ABC-2 type transport system ATP-binding protein
MGDPIQPAPAITATGLTKSFPGVRAVDALSIDVHAGEIFGLVGPDGAGKTTTLRMLAGIMPPDAGQATVAGFNVVRDPEGAKHALSYMPQRFGLYEDLTVDENIRFYADLFGVRKAERTTRSTELLQAAGMSEFRTRMAGKLSGGMKQKLAPKSSCLTSPPPASIPSPAATSGAFSMNSSLKAWPFSPPLPISTKPSAVIASPSCIRANFSSATPPPTSNHA